MSHFSVLVVTQTPGHEALARALQPYHEFESTGIDDDYVQTIETTDTLREEYMTDTIRRFVAPDGTTHDPYADRFYRDPTPAEQSHVGIGTGFGHGIAWHAQDWGDGCGYRPKVHALPERWTEAYLPIRSLMSFAVFCRTVYDVRFLVPGEPPNLAGAHKYGYGILTVQGEVQGIWRRTNPQKQWNAWTLGGRYSGRLWIHGATAPCDQGRVGDLDLSAMHQYARRRREVLWAQAQELDERRRADFYDIGPEATREAFCACPALETFAILDHEGWWASGKIGWWGSIRDTDTEWSARYAEYLHLLQQHPEQYIAIVDCHI